MTKTAKMARWFVLLLWCALIPAAYAASELRVVLVLSDRNPFYQSFANTYRQALQANIQLTELRSAEDFDAQTADLIVTVGVKAADRVAARSTAPMLAVMVPSNTYADLRDKQARSRPISAIFLDQPWERQAMFLRSVLPERRKIGVLYSADTRLDIPALRTALSAHGFSLSGQAMNRDDDLFTRLEDVLLSSEILLAVPDSAIYTGNTIRNILLSSYRRGIPLVGFSQAYVRAGALCAIFSTPEHLAAQAGDVTYAFARKRELPEAQYPSFYDIAVNQEVARTLGLTIQSPEVLRAQLEKSQVKPR